MANPIVSLRKMVRAWDNKTRDESEIRYAVVLEDLLYHGEVRFGDYVQFSSEGDFTFRLYKWLENVPTMDAKKTLLWLASRLLFVDREQMLSLHRDAYRCKIVPWLTTSFSIGDLLARDYEQRVRAVFREHALASVTESLGWDNFLHVNDLAGLPKPLILGERSEDFGAVLKPLTAKQGLIVMEDFVGTGKQAAKVLTKLRAAVPSEWRVLFVPLILLERGVSRLRSVAGVELAPVLVVPEKACISKTPHGDESREASSVRALVMQTASTVTEPLDDSFDDPPTDEFGYGGCGALIVTAHNAPNNTLPLIHHRSPRWNPLFRRLHHSKDGLA
jgi:hypothetical protein